MYDSSNLGTRLRNLRLENELTQEELANRSELTKGYISQLENNLASPSISTLEDILEVLGSSLSEFFANDESQEKVVYQKGWISHIRISVDFFIYFSYNVYDACPPGRGAAEDLP